jgi:hypothetical protein
MNKGINIATPSASRLSRGVVIALLSIVALTLLTARTNATALPECCQDIARADPAAPDGLYTIYPRNNPTGFRVYCHDMAGTPREYLELINTGGNFNFATFGGESAAPPAEVVTTYYTRIRLDPVTLLVDISDQTFATSTGSDCCIASTVVTSVPYGTASDCLEAFSNTGRANIDLTGTPFRVNDAFGVSGAAAMGSVNGQIGTDFSFDDDVFPVFPVIGQVVNLTGGGFCGGTFSFPRPQAFFPPVNTTGGFILQLQHPGSIPVPPLATANHLVRFQPVQDTFSLTSDTAGCSAGFVGTFRFQARLINTSAQSLAGVFVQVAELSNGNQLITGEDAFAVPEIGDYTDGMLGLGESVDVPITVCLKTRQSFRLLVDVLAQIIQ